MDVKVPSEHHQEGRRYSAEIQMAHFYSLDYDNEMATVSVFMDVGKENDHYAPYPFLDKVICQWRRAEYSVRQQCGLAPVASTYPGCFPLFRDRNLKTNNDNNLRNRKIEDIVPDDDALFIDDRPSNGTKPPFKTVADILYFNAATGRNSTLDLEDANYDPAEEKDWAAWILEQSKKMQQQEELYHKLKDNDYGGKHSDEMHEHYRRLIQGDEMEWFNYWPLIGVRSE